MGRDVTHERSLEGQLRQSQKMEAVGQLTAGIAHDFNNVLSIISINAELCVEDLEAGVPIEPESLVAVQEATRRAAKITEQLLGFSRQAELTVDPVNLGVLVNGMSGLIRTAVPESVALVLQADESVPTVDVDRQSVEQIVLNFVTNGRDAMPDGGSLTVSVREKTIDSLYREAHPDVVPGGYVEIVVTDTGTGMDALTQARIFEPFFTTKSTGSGTGLGMAMAYGLAKQQGGHIQAYSDLGRGTTVRALFPVSKQTEGVTRAAHAQPQRRLGTETILLVEDEPAVQAAAAKALERQGYTILSASDGVEGLAAYRAHSESIDLVITDLVMPNMGGRELCAALREADPRLPILVTSGYSGQEAPHGGVDRSIEFLLKPWDLDTLLSTMRGLLDRRPQSRAEDE